VAIYFLLQYRSPSGLNPVSFISVICWASYVDLAKLSFKVDWVLRFKMWASSWFCFYLFSGALQRKVKASLLLRHWKRKSSRSFAILRLQDWRSLAQ